TNDGHKRSVGESALEKPRHQNVRRRFLQQKAFGEVPVGKPVNGELSLVIGSQQFRVFGQVCASGKGKAAGAAVNNTWRIHRLKKLAFVFQAQPLRGDLIVGEAAHFGMLPQHPEQKRRPAAMEPAAKQEIMSVYDFPCLIEIDGSTLACCWGHDGLKVPVSSIK